MRTVRNSEPVSAGEPDVETTTATATAEPAATTETPAQSTEQSKSAQEQTEPTQATAEAGTEGEAKAEPTSETPKADWRELIKDADPKELRKDPKIAGIVGHILEEERRKAADKAARDAENALLAQDDGPYAQHVKQQRQAQSGFEDFDSLADERVQALPEPLREKIAGKFFPGTPGAARRAFMAELIELEREAATETLKPALDKAAKEAFEAGEKAALAKMASGERSPALGRGDAQAPTLTQDEWTAHRKDPDWRRSNRERINAAVSAGRITN